MTNTILVYVDRPPAGYRLASNNSPIEASGMVYWPATASQAAHWGAPNPGENVIGATVNELWPVAMGYAIPIRQQEESCGSV